MVGRSVVVALTVALAGCQSSVTDIPVLTTDSDLVYQDCIGAGALWQVQDSWARLQMDENWEPREVNGEAALGVYVLACDLVEFGNRTLQHVRFATWWIPAVPTTPEAPEAEEYEWILEQVHAVDTSFAKWWQAEGIFTSIGNIEAALDAGTTGSAAFTIQGGQGEIRADLVPTQGGLRLDRSVLLVGRNGFAMMGHNAGAGLLATATFAYSGDTWASQVNPLDATQSYTLEEFGGVWS